MKTTVKSTNGGFATVNRMGPSLVSVEVSNQGHYSDNTYLDKHAAYVLGNALIELAKTIEREEFVHGRPYPARVVEL